MNRYKNMIAIIVPTKDNPEDLYKLLKSMQGLTVRPDQLIIVDGSDGDIGPVMAQFKDLDIDYLRVRPPGLTRQRNAGIGAVTPPPQRIAEHHDFVGSRLFLFRREAPTRGGRHAEKLEEIALAQAAGKE